MTEKTFKLFLISLFFTYFFTFSELPSLDSNQNHNKCAVPLQPGTLVVTFVFGSV